MVTKNNRKPDCSSYLKYLSLHMGFKETHFKPNKLLQLATQKLTSAIDMTEL